MSKSCVIKSEDARCPGLYLTGYDPEAHDGRGSCTWGDREDAIVYPGFKEAFETWRAIPKSRPRRPDGKPNRPLTSFTVTFEQDEQHTLRAETREAKP